MALTAAAFGLTCVNGLRLPLVELAVSKGTQPSLCLVSPAVTCELQKIVTDMHNGAVRQAGVCQNKRLLQFHQGLQKTGW